MYDCSTDPYDVNVQKVKEMADIAHSYGATIEGELGHVGDNEGSAEGSSHMEDPSKFFTDPKLAKDYVEKTGVDALAIAVGNAHGAYKLPPKLDFERIKTIANTVNVPLYLGLAGTFIGIITGLVGIAFNVDTLFTGGETAPLRNLLVGVVIATFIISVVIVVSIVIAFAVGYAAFSANTFTLFLLVFVEAFVVVA
jgi:hypothetical protein